MIFRLRARLTLLILAILTATSVAATAQSAQRAVSTGPSDVPLTQAVPVDPRITVGTLPNGMRYYIRANKRPEGRA